MKRICAILIFCALAFSLSACQSDQADKPAGETTAIVAEETAATAENQTEAKPVESENVQAEAEASSGGLEAEKETVEETTAEKENTATALDSEKQTASETPANKTATAKETANSDKQEYIIHLIDCSAHIFNEKIDVDWAIEKYGLFNIVWIENGDEIVYIADNGDIKISPTHYTTEVINGVLWNHQYDDFVEYGYEGEKPGYRYQPALCEYVPWDGKEPEPYTGPDPSPQPGDPDYHYWGDVSGLSDGDPNTTNHAPRGTFWTSPISGITVYQFDDFNKLSEEEVQMFYEWQDSWFY